MNKNKKLTKDYYLILVLLIGICFVYPLGYFMLEEQNDEDFQQLVESQKIASYIINLDRSAERLKTISPYIEGLDIPHHRVSAVDGKLLSEDEIAKLVDLKTYKNFMGKPPSKGTVGCSLSHIKAWKEFLHSKNEFAIFFEDDVSFEPEQLKDVLEQLVINNKDWDIVSFDISHRGMPMTVKNLNGDKSLVVYLTEVAHAGAYMLNKKSAQKLLKKSMPIKMPIDHYFTRSWEFGLRFSGVEPRIVHQTYGDSEIGAIKDGYEGYNDKANPIVRAIYKLQSYSIRFFYNLNAYISAK
jgi:glycosyl transferase family 25